MALSTAKSAPSAKSRDNPPAAPMVRDQRVQLKSRVTAVLLAILFPGGGHWYQGRRFKATIFTVCIMTVFVWGMVLGNWQPVYSQIALPQREHETVQFERSVPRTEYSFGFIAQVMMGGPALPALVQQTRFRTDPGLVTALTEPLSSTFSGILSVPDDELNLSSGMVTGDLKLEPAGRQGKVPLVTGTFSGTLDDGSSVDVRLGGSVQLGRAVFGSPCRQFNCSIYSPDGDPIGFLEGSVERRFTDWFMAPRDYAEMDRLHGKLNAQFDIALVFTWIAGLLNLLVIWDAADGPAYGYGDETVPDDDDESDD